MSDEAEFEADGLLDGLEGTAREERIELLHWLRDDYRMSREALQQSTDQGTIVLAASGRTLGPAERYSANDIARRTGLDAELLSRCCGPAGCRHRTTSTRSSTARRIWRPPGRSSSSLTPGCSPSSSSTSPASWGGVWPR